LVIRSFRHKGLHELFTTGRSAKVPAELVKRCTNLLAVLNAATALTDMIGFLTHRLQDTGPVRYAMSVDGPWRITFEWEPPDVHRVDLEQYH
jgi:proteic killer suppression protein